MKFGSTFDYYYLYIFEANNYNQKCCAIVVGQCSCVFFCMIGSCFVSVLNMTQESHFGWQLFFYDSKAF